MSKQFSQWVERNKVFINLEENKLLALVLYGESRGESWQGKIAVLNIVRNRVIETPKYSDKIIIDISGGGCLYHRSEEHTSELHHIPLSRMPSSA